MKKLWLHSVRAYLQLGLFFYFKEIKVVNANSIPKDKPVLFLANHQNALLDALLIATTSGRFSYFLTRAAVFNKTFVSKLLNSLQMLPVYRIRDGWSTLINNNAIFKSCISLLHKKEAIVIFPEGSHNLKRTVRPLSKGFTRIVLDMMERYPDADLQLIPVGLNFINAKSFVDSTAIYYGSAIDAKQYVQKNRSEAAIKLKQDIHGKLCQLTTHIDNENYENTLQRLENLHIDFLDPKGVNACIANNFNECNFKQRKKVHILKKFLKTLLILNLILPYVVWKFVVQPKIKEIEFTSTFRFALAITLVPIWIAGLVILFGLTTGWLIALAYLFAVLGLTLGVVKT